MVTAPPHDEDRVQDVAMPPFFLSAHGSLKPHPAHQRAQYPKFISTTAVLLNH
jgi:hypothetical protein